MKDKPAYPENYGNECEGAERTILGIISNLGTHQKVDTLPRLIEKLREIHRQALDDYAGF